jgi:hypothetical protein
VPQTDLWLRMGRTWITSTIKEDIVWYQKYDSERSANSNYLLGWKVPLTRLSFSVRGNWISTRDRPGYEIDQRSQRLETTYGGTAELRAFSKTFFGATGSWYSQNFDRGVVFLGTNLHDELNHTTTTGGLNVRYLLTPLTTLAFAATRAQDRFEFSSLRDSNSTGLSGTVTFDPAALIKGTATFGYRDFQPLSPDLPSYQGNTMTVALSYTVFGTTKLDVGALRDVQYSFDVNQPYYLTTGVTGTVAQQIYGPLDVVGRAARQSLAYRDRVGAIVVASGRVDYIRSYGGGIGYHFGKNARLGFNLDQSRRTSNLESRRYSGLRYGTSITYGS